LKRSIIIDTDPGQDDAVALLLALASPEELDLRAIVCVAGNVPLAKNVTNALKIVELSGRTDVPVYAGSEKPMHRPPITAEYVHGKTGLDGSDLPEPTITPQKQHGVDFLIETLTAAAPGEITLCTLGPLTNIGTVLERTPALAPKVREIVMMGGAYFEVGNRTPAAEFNVLVDPEAADIVMRSGIPITMLPLDVTHQMLTTHDRLDRFRNIGNRSCAQVAGMLNFSERFDLAKYGWIGAPLHDPCVIAWLLRPEIFSGRHVNVTIETQSELTLGMTVADYWHVTDRPKNVFYVRDGNAPAFFDLLAERIARLP
jgi:purine nucleosidase